MLDMASYACKKKNLEESSMSGTGIMQAEEERVVVVKAGRSFIIYRCEGWSLRQGKHRTSRSCWMSLKANLFQMGFNRTGLLVICPSYSSTRNFSYSLMQPCRLDSRIKSLYDHRR